MEAPKTEHRTPGTGPRAKIERVEQPTRPPKPRPAEDREVDYLICQTCTTPSYIFEMEGGLITEAQCLVCGNDEPSQFSPGEDAGSEQS